MPRFDQALRQRISVSGIGGPLTYQDTLIGKRRPVQYALTGKPMVVRKCDEVPFGPERRDLAPRPRLRSRDERDIKIQSGDGGCVLPNFTFDEVDMDAAVMLVIGAEQLGEKPRRKRRQDADRDPAVLRSSDRGDIFRAVPHVPEYVFGLPAKPLAGEGQPHPAIMALEQRCAELVLQITDAAADRGFLHAERGSGLAKTAMLSSG